MKKGKVYLIGAGPGDAELLTLKAVRLLGECDVILLDALANREVLRFARPDAQVIEAGKRGGCRSVPQLFIQRQMIALARQGRTVGRVKGGDPFIFGRGGEEMQALREAGIEVEAVSGVTAATAAAAALGIALTHRDFAHGVTFVAGHARDGAPVDWRALAQSGTTLAIYMGMSDLPGIAAQLLGAGMPPATPCAVIQHGTLPQQKSVVSDLAHLSAVVAAAGLASPAIVVIGEVARMARQVAMADAVRAVA